MFLKFWVSDSPGMMLRVLHEHLSEVFCYKKMKWLHKNAATWVLNLNISFVSRTKRLLSLIFLQVSESMCFVGLLLKLLCEFRYSLVHRCFPVVFVFVCVWADLRSIPPSKEALRHSGGESLLFTSAMVTLYLEVELSSDRRPGTEQNRSVGFTTHVPPAHEHNTGVTGAQVTGVGMNTRKTMSEKAENLERKLQRCKTLKNVLLKRSSCGSLRLLLMSLNLDYYVDNIGLI